MVSVNGYLETRHSVPRPNVRVGRAVPGNEKHCSCLWSTDSITLVTLWLPLGRYRGTQALEPDNEDQSKTLGDRY